MRPISRLAITVWVSLSLGACTSYEVVSRPTAQDGLRYIKRETWFIFLVSRRYLRCTESRGSVTSCVPLQFVEVDVTPPESMPCTPTMCGNTKQPPKPPDNYPDNPYR